MRFCYQYRTSDNALHEDAVDAADRDAAFRALKARGIRPARLWEAPGLVNRVVGKGKRWAAIAVLSVLAVAFASMLATSRRKTATLTGELQALAEESIASPRHQIYGDPVVMDPIESGRFELVFDREGDRLLARYAQPGRLVLPPGTAPMFLNAEACASIRAVLAEDAPIADADSREIRELKQIVNGMRRELRAYLQNGIGTVETYWRRLNERTEQECAIYDRTLKELESETSEAVWAEKNEALRRIGLRTIPRRKLRP